MLPALPTGRQWMSGASPRASTTWNAAVFWPSMRAGLTELTKLDGVGLGELARQGEAVVEVAVDLQQRRAVRDGLAQLAHRDLAVGHEHAAGQFGLRGVAAADALVLPVLAQMTARAPAGQRG